MTDDTNTGADSADEQALDSETLAVKSTYKILGEFAASDGTGVLGRNTAGSGTPIGVQGAVTNDDGYGLATPDDARIEGTIDTNRTDFVVEAGTQFDDEAKNIIMGIDGNSVGDRTQGATIAGGGSYGNTGEPHEVTAFFGTIGGGTGNMVSGDESGTIGGGSSNSATGDSPTIGGGKHNETDGNYTTVAGGIRNTASGRGAAVCGGGKFDVGEGNEASGNQSFVGGGFDNTASGEGGTVPGGKNNVASGTYALAAGSGAHTQTSGDSPTVHDGAFVWGDSSGSPVHSDATDQVVFQAGGGMKVYTDSDTSTDTGAELPANDGSWTSLSSRTAKSDIEPVNPPEVLEQVESLDVSTWQYSSQDGDVQHMGPMAEAFHDAFGLGHDEQQISTVDADGVLFAAVQGLSKKLDDVREELDARDDRNDDLEADNEQLRRQNEDLRKELDEKDDRIDSLEERLAALEAQIGTTTQPADD